MALSSEEEVAHLEEATKGFDLLFANEIDQARKTFSAKESPFHALGLGICAFLEAALGMETNLMSEASRCLTLSESGAKKQIKLGKNSSASGRFLPGLEWELLHADAVILLGLTHALSESYMGYLQCLYALNSAHSKFAKMYKAVFPSGLDDYETPASSPGPSRKPSTPSIRSLAASVNSTATATPPARPSFFGRWGSSNSSSSVLKVTTVQQPEGPVEELILSGAAFGFGLFNLVFSLLPAKVKGVAGFFGYTSDRKVALRALAVSAARSDVHSVFAGLVLMTYHGVVLLLAGYQADEEHILKQYRAIVDRVLVRYPTGSLWILNRAKILRMSGDAEAAIKVLEEGLSPEHPQMFVQADALLLFELAWTLLAQRRYEESAEMFIKMTERNSWSHATYLFIAAGCYISVGNRAKAQELLDGVPVAIEKRKLHGRDLPTEVFIKKKIAFYKEKQKRRRGNEAEYVQCISISPAEELGLFWNTHARIGKDVSEAHIKEWAAFSPPVTIQSPYITETPAIPEVADLDTEDELALRSLLLGIVHRTAGSYAPSRAFLMDAAARQSKIRVSTWIPGVAMFELAVLDLKELEAEDKKAGRESQKEAWKAVLKSASNKLDTAFSLSGKEIDLSSRLDTRIAMLRDEIMAKREMVGLSS
ncbi:hypothetical protein NEOLEDRAFT_1142229 [Neolentinus lepideus HHB14362 ss-1]|uniref:Mitochondrial outer membrane protein IML2 n=1 Tax=Neolentinus lepideus HHB14362 ss-1 TaxID=1314782 RepID=A0A165N8S0_9AGAM|nr:hypothetical protein NEOLEDRAFT_1142229 [Neolentinus lepideus HHB14362 ss-1]